MSRIACCRMLVWMAALVMSSNVIGAEPSEADRQAADKAIRAAADSFLAAFKQRDAAAVAAHWTPNGVYVNEDGERYEGRKAIEAEYAALFKEAPEDLGMRIEVDSVRLVNSDTAIEEGRTALTPQPVGEVRVMSRYTAVHVKQEGKWLMTDVRDTLVELPPDAGQLADLDWMVGTWTAANDDRKVEVKVRWLQNKRFLGRTHAVIEGDKAVAGGFEIIGLDPSAGRITSWTFDSEGGHAIGLWAPHDNGWLIESVGVTADGTESTATYSLTPKGKDMLIWKSANREIGGTLLPDAQEVTLQRK